MLKISKKTNKRKLNKNIRLNVKSNNRNPTNYKRLTKSDQRLTKFDQRLTKSDQRLTKSDQYFLRFKESFIFQLIHNLVS
jgi:hypothetical protein